RDGPQPTPNASRCRGAAAGPAGAPAADSPHLAPRSALGGGGSGGNRGERAAGSGESHRRPGGGRAPSAAPGLQGPALAPRPASERPPAPGLAGRVALGPDTPSPPRPGGLAASAGAAVARARLCDEVHAPLGRGPRTARASRSGRRPCASGASRRTRCCRWAGFVPDQWTGPGGGLEPQEEPAGAAVREAFQEAGVKGKSGRFLGIFENQDRKHRAYVYVLNVTEILEDWEDSVNTGRKTEWFKVKDAIKVLQCHKPVHAEYLEKLKLGCSPTSGNSTVPSLPESNTLFVAAALRTSGLPSSIR
ncbi:uncharacterized protein LOC141576104, partial [Camelus bactrianus]|uniref:Uncharacterized protein LOC141576104 n=1 Tax=Camelus bactrianus TaxID=9837 RepID=A0AC58PXC5_CAMBA